MLGALAVVVAALTFLFNLVGALCVSVIAGMMAGASRKWTWQLLLVSLVPVLVVVGLGSYTHVGLDLRQRALLASVCFGAFWATYIVTLLAMHLEARSEPTQASSPSRRKALLTEARSVLPQPAPLASSAKAQLTVNHFQGTWLSETNRPHGHPRKKVFIVERGKFYLSLVNSHGHTRLLAKGDVTVHDTASGKSVVISKGSAGVPLSPG